MSKNPKNLVALTLTFGTCLGCQNTKSVLMKYFGGACSERCQRRVEKKVERAALAELKTLNEARKTAEMEASRLRVRLDQANALATKHHLTLKSLTIPARPSPEEVAQLKRAIGAFEEYLTKQIAYSRKLDGQKRYCR